MELLAILGRGIQKIEEKGPWVLTDDLEMCDEKGAHLPVRVPVDDENPNCLVGGGNMNLVAGYWLGVEYQPRVVVCAYGGRSAYLQSVNGPTESVIMDRMLVNMLMEAANSGGFTPGVHLFSHGEFIAWPREKTVPGPSNTNRELQNIFELAVERGLTKVGVVTVAVHYARTLLMAERHLVKPEFSHLEFQCYASEDVLLRVDSEMYGPRIRAMHFSKAFMRTLFREVRGINFLLAGNY